MISQFAVGIDIADHSIEVVKLKKSGRKFDIVSKNKVDLSSGIVKAGRIIDTSRLSGSLIHALQNAAPEPIEDKQVFFALPDSQVFTHVFSLQQVKKKEIEQVLHGYIVDAIPIKNHDLVFDYHVIKQSKEQIEVAVVATSKEVLLEWKSFFSQAGLDLQLFDLETLSTYRDLYARTTANSVCIVDFGAVTTNISFFDEHGIRYTRTLPVGGDAITQLIVQHAKLTEEKAEQHKKKLGMAQKNAKAKQAIHAFVEELSEKIKKTIEHFESSREHDIEQVLCVGGSSLLKGYIKELQAILGKPTELGTSHLTEENNTFVFVEAIGIAARPLDPFWRKQDLSFPVSGYKTHKVDIAKKVKQTEKFRKKKLIHSKVFKEVVFFILLLGIGASFLYWFMGYKSDQATQRSLMKQQEAARAVANLPELPDVDEGKKKEKPKEKKVESISVMATSTLPSSTTGTLSTLTEVLQEDEEGLFVEVLPTGIGYLNVRKEPSTAGEKVTEILEGQEFELLEYNEAKTWAKLQIDEGQVGWVSAQYVEEIE